MTISVTLAGVSGILSLSGVPGNVAGCQSLSLWERWHGEAVTERARMLTKSKKHSDTSPVCQRHRIAVLSCFILPGLPSQALARQLSQRESPWQGGVVFDETDLRFAGKRHGMPKPLLLGEVARRSRDGEVVQSSTCVIPFPRKASFVQPLSLASARQLP